VEGVAVKRVLEDWFISGDIGSVRTGQGDGGSASASARELRGVGNRGV